MRKYRIRTEKVADAIKERVDILPYVKPMDTHATRAAASKKLIEMPPKGFKKVLGYGAFFNVKKVYVLYLTKNIYILI